MLIREGGVIALNVAEQHFDRRADQRGFLVVPAQGAGEAVGGCIEDDGETEAWREGQHGRWNVRAMSDAHTVTLHVSREGRMPTQADTVEILLPAGDSRTVQTPQARVLETAVEGGWRRLTLQLQA
jgi:alpha-glucosidase